MTELPLISRPLCTFTPDDYRDFVRAMYALPEPSRSAKPPSPAPGLAVARTRKGAISIRRNKSKRSFDWATMREVHLLAAAAGCSQADLWNALKRRDFIIAMNRLEAEQIYATIQEIPWKGK